MNLALWLQRAAAQWPDRPALGHGVTPHSSYADFARATARCASGLRGRGIAPGDRVGLFMANAPHYLVALWGIWWAGAVAVPMNARLHGREAGWIAGHSGCLYPT